MRLGEGGERREAREVGYMWYPLLSGYITNVLDIIDLYVVFILGGNK